jgi:hypothetical protein
MADRSTYTIRISEAHRRILQAVLAHASDETLDALNRETLRDTDGEMIDADEEVENLRSMLSGLEETGLNDFTM